MAQVRPACPQAALGGRKQHVAHAARRPEPAAASGSAWRQRRQRRRPVACPSSSLSNGSSSRPAASPEAAALLDQFWLARGVVDEQQRRCELVTPLGWGLLVISSGRGGRARADKVACRLRRLERPCGRHWRRGQPLPLSTLSVTGNLLHCRQLVAAAGALCAELDAEVFESSQQQLGLQLPSLSAAWFLEEQQGSSPQVRGLGAGCVEAAGGTDGAAVGCLPCVAARHLHHAASFSPNC